MLWRHRCLVRAWSAAGLLTCALLGGPAVAEPEGAPPQTETETVKVLEAQKAGDLKIDVRGHGQDRVRMVLRNTSATRLNVVLPPGLVAASATGQRAGGGGFQSMGLGAPADKPGGFGAFQGAANRGDSGFQSVPVSGESRVKCVAVPAGHSIELALPAVCLNYGLPTPTPRDKFQLMDVDDFSNDPRVRKALRSLATIGTSQGVAQAAMWRVANDISFELMTTQAIKVVNAHEIALAAKFVEALDATNSELVDPAYLTENRVLVGVRGDGALARDARRLAGELEGLRLLGLPVRVVDAEEPPEISGPSLRLTVTLANGSSGATQCRLLATYATLDGQWAPLGRSTFAANAAPAVLDGKALAKALDHAVAATFVAVKPAKHGVGSTTLKVDNRLPFTLSTVVVKSGDSAGAPTVSFPGLGVGPGRSALAPAIAAPGGPVDRVELNGL